MIAQNSESMCLSSWCVLPGSIFRRGISSSSSGFRYCSSDAFFLSGLSSASDGNQTGFKCNQISFFLISRMRQGPLKKHFRCSEWTSQSLMGSRGFDGHQVSRAGIFDVRWFSNASWHPSFACSNTISLSGLHSDRRKMGFQWAATPSLVSLIIIQMICLGLKTG